MRGGREVSRWRDVWFLPGAANAAAPRGVVYFEGVSRSREADAAASLRYEARAMEIRRQFV